MIYKYFNEYPVLTNDALYSSQEQIKNVIKQFDTAMLAAGLVRSSDTGQLDTNNIPDLDIINGLQAKTSVFYSRSSTGSGTYVSHKPLIYCFTDSLQETSPVYIKIVFDIGRMRYYPAYNLPPAGTDILFPLFLTSYWQVSNSTDGAGILTQPLTFYSNPFGGTSDQYYNNKITTITNYSYEDSVIHYDKDKGLLMVRVCPMYKVATSDNQFIYSMTTAGDGLNCSLVNMLILRSPDGVISALGYPNQSLPISSGSEPYLKIFKFKSKNVNYEDYNYQAPSGIYMNTTSFINGKISLSTINLFDPYTNRAFKRPELLTGNINDVGKLSASNYSVKISETETVNYYTLSPWDNGYRLLNGTAGSIATLLIYSGNDKYER